MRPDNSVEQKYGKLLDRRLIYTTPLPFLLNFSKEKTKEIKNQVDSICGASVLNYKCPLIQQIQQNQYTEN
jgi:hypothetical protein